MLINKIKKADDRFYIYHRLLKIYFYLYLSQKRELWFFHFSDIRIIALSIDIDIYFISNDALLNQVSFIPTNGRNELFKL